MDITWTSGLTGKTRTREMDLTPAQIAAWEGGELIQDVAPHLSSKDREFVMTGITPGEWRTAFGRDDDDPSPEAP